MITQQLINPKSIVVIGASNDVTKPGGKLLKNLIDHQFAGDLYVSNPKEDKIQGIKSYRDLNDLPQTDLAILAIAAKYCPDTVDLLARQKGTRAFIILSAGFHEENEEGAILERRIVATIEETGGCLIGPNCIGVMNPNYAGVFTLPIPMLVPHGVDFITGSGATAVFIIENAVLRGLNFSSVFSVGNSAHIGVEEVLEYFDETFDPKSSSKVKLLYVESINNPSKLLKHAISLIRKGCHIAAVKSGGSEAGSRAASSHTGALASSDIAVDALFRKAGIVRCNGREELVTIASIFMHKELKGNRMAIITHAGGPAVMLTDALSNGGMKVPPIKNPKADDLLRLLFPGSSVANPIDFLATGTAEQLGNIIDYCDRDFNEVDGMAVIFGSPGLFEVYDVYKLLHEKMSESRKPIYPILPSLVNVRSEIDYFLGLGRINFPDEVAFGNALCKVWNTPAPPTEESDYPMGFKPEAIRAIIDQGTDGYLSPDLVQALLDAAGIDRAGEAVVTSCAEAVASAKSLGMPVVMKVVGPVHKSDVGGVVLNVSSEEQVALEFERLIRISDTTAVLIQPMLSGIELFAGAMAEPKFGHTILCGLGGIFIEVLKDVTAGLAPLCKSEAMDMITRLKSSKIFEGVRGQPGVSIDLFAENIVRLSLLVHVAPEIVEMDLNPLLGTPNRVVTVDARIRIIR